MRRRVIGGAIVVVALLALALLLDGPIGGSLGPFTPPANADTRPLGEIGPGACWPEDQRPSGGTAIGFAHENGAKEAAGWFRLPENKAVAERQDRWYNTHKDYYLIYEVVPEWDQLDPVERVARYIEQLSVVKLEKPIYVYNTHCKNGEVEAWEPQVLPKGEWTGFVRGHEPGKPDMRPVKKMVCGNDLFEVPPPSPEQSATVPPGTPGCEEKGNCPTPSTPPNCTYPCGKEQKDPNKDPGAQGKAGGNDGKNTDQSEGEFIPDNGMTRPPETTRQNQDPVVPPPAAPPTVTPNPNPGPVQTVQPSAQPPNHGVVPTSLPPEECNPLFHDNCPAS